MLERPQTGILQKKEIPAILNAMGQGRDSLAMDGITPSFALNFAEGGSIRNQAATATFTRATTATVVDHDSIVRTALSGEARMQGLRRVQNNVVGSENIAVTGSSTSGGTGTTATCVAGFTAPDGTTTAFRIQASIGVGTLNADFSAWQLSGVMRIGSCWIKSNTGSPQVTLGSFAGAGNIIAVDATWRRYTWTNNGPSAISFGCLGNIGTSKAIDILVWHPQAENDPGQSVPIPSEYLSTGVLSSPYNGVNVDGVKYFPTLNGNTVSNNIVTEAAGAYIPASTRLGYLSEGARTNLCLQSGDVSNATWAKTRVSVASSVIVDPSGNTSFSVIEDATATSTHALQQAFAKAASAIQYTVSLWARPSGRSWIVVQANDGANTATVSFNITTGAVGTVTTSGAGYSNQSQKITSYPNGWYKIEMTYTTAATAADNLILYLASADNTVTYSGNGASFISMWGVNKEQAAFASSYIPTTTVAVTRNADVLTYPLTGWYNTVTGSIFGSWQCYATQAVTQVLASINNNVTTDYISIERFSGNVFGAIVAGGVTQAAVASTAVNAGVQSKVAMAYAANDAVASTNGAAISTDATVTLPTVAILGIGNTNAVNSTFGTVAFFNYFPRRLTNNQLVNMTR